MPVIIYKVEMEQDNPLILGGLVLRFWKLGDEVQTVVKFPVGTNVRLRVRGTDGLGREGPWSEWSNWYPQIPASVGG